MHLPPMNTLDCVFVVPKWNLNFCERINVDRFAIRDLNPRYLADIAVATGCCLVGSNVNAGFPADGHRHINSRAHYQQVGTNNAHQCDETCCHRLHVFPSDASFAQAFPEKCFPRKTFS